MNIGSQFLTVAGGYNKECGISKDVSDLLTCNVYGVSVLTDFKATDLNDNTAEVAKVRLSQNSSSSID